MPELRMLLSLRSHESRTRRRLALCDELCGSLEAMYRAARALAASGLGGSSSQASSCIRKAPASVHTICSVVRDFADALNRVFEVVGFDMHGDPDEPAAAAESPLTPVVRETLFKAIDEHTALRSWDGVSWVGLSVDSRRRIEFHWSVAMECLRTNPQKGYPAFRPIVLLARRLADEGLRLLDPATGPIAEERGSAYSTTKKLRAQIDRIRALVNCKCDALEGEMRAVQTAIIKAQSQTMSLVKNLSNIGPAG
ncbi:MAG: hypothetical protein ABIF82_00230 [Planctomycetota bacterium]